VRATYTTVGQNINNAAQAAEIPQRAAAAARDAAAFPLEQEARQQRVELGRESLTPEALSNAREMAAAKLAQAKQEVEQNRLALEAYPEDRAISNAYKEAQTKYMLANSEYKETMAAGGGAKPLTPQGKSQILGKVNTLLKDRAAAMQAAAKAEASAKLLEGTPDLAQSRIAQAQQYRQRVKEIDAAILEQRELLAPISPAATNETTTAPTQPQILTAEENEAMQLYPGVPIDQIRAILGSQ
jgi:hypothetical protein